jgi:hypothetical protein
MAMSRKLVRVDEQMGVAVMANIVRRNPSATKLTDAEARKLLEQIAAMAVELVAHWSPGTSVCAAMRIQVR